MAETSATPPPPLDLQQVSKATTQIQEQLLLMQRELAQDREAARAVAAHNGEAISNGLYALEQALSLERARDLETWHSSSQALQRSNRVMLSMAAVLAGTGFLALLILTWFQWRTTTKLAEFSSLLPIGRALTAGAEQPRLASGDAAGHTGDPVISANQRLLGALEQLDQRIRELKGAVSAGHEKQPPTVTREVSSEADDPSRIPLLFEQANAMLKADNTEGALACFDEVLLLAPNHAEALVKKGAVLERMHKLNEAIACYDRAIAADNSLTFAYLHKGGLCSRLERFKEALECYEKALLTHEQR